MGRHLEDEGRQTLPQTLSLKTARPSISRAAEKGPDEAASDGTVGEGQRGGIGCAPQGATSPMEVFSEAAPSVRPLRTKTHTG